MISNLSLENLVDAEMHRISPTPSIPMTDASHLNMHLLLPISKAAVYFFPWDGLSGIWRREILNLTESVFKVELADIVAPENVEVCGGKVVFVIGLGTGV